jgi:ribonuclease BN (tRNA processing enzyme)
VTELLVLGSGGPFINPGRASSAFILTTDDGRRILIDAGGGAFERMGQAGISAAELELVLLTHFHIDHSGGLAPVVFSAYMEGRTEALTVAGPSARDGQPGAVRFCAALFGPDGAWSYLHSFEGFEIMPLEGSSELDEPRAELLLDERGLVVSTVAVPHGMMPSLAYRIDHGGTSVVFSGDVQSVHEPLVALARECDLLVHDLALPERETEHGPLHAKPSEVGKVARDCGCRRLLVNHVMPELEDELDEALRELRRFYDGPLVVAEDLLRVTV